MSTLNDFKLSEPGSATLAPNERRALLDDIGRIGLTLGRELPDSPCAPAPLTVLPHGSAQAEEPRTILERMRLLATLWPRMQAALLAIERRPETALTTALRQTLPAQAQGGPKTVAALARSPHAPMLWKTIQRHDSARGARARPQPRLAESRPQETEDTPVNRLAVALLLAAEREAIALTRLALFWDEETEAMRLTPVLEGARLRRATAPLGSLAPSASPLRSAAIEGAASLRCSPPYRALFEAWRQYGHPLQFDWSQSPALALPPLEGWRLYEIWCFLQVAAALQTTGWRLVEGDALRWEPDGLRLALATGQTSRLRFTHAASKRADDDQGLELFYQPYFPSANRQPGPPAEGVRVFGSSEAVESSPGEKVAYASVTHAMQPDIGLRCGRRYYLLDPKFRSYAEPGAEQTDIDKMHAYRDAIVRWSPGAASTRAVAAAWCLFPGEQASLGLSVNQPIRAYPAPAAAHPFGTAGIGALRLRPGDPDSLSLLARLLNHWLTNTKEP